ncbi:MAG: hypothetical protein ABJN34_03650 [Litoreibacter sp.]|uniref:alginate O-acetyltransferase AlgX-related protein n=1 Tax=Litoreibacter sp. TaxID=1969459 RepID=UPI0032980120
MSFRLVTKLTVPLTFFGYAAFANLSLFTGEAEKPVPDALLNGEFTSEIDSLYRANLPHREPAVGLVGALRYLTLNEGRKGVVAGESGWLFTDEEFRDQDIALQGLSETLDWIVTIQQDLATYGTELVLVPIPAKIEFSQTPSHTDQITAIAATYDTFVSNTIQAGIKTVDTRSALESTELAFFHTDTHWTIEGAAAVAESLSQSGLVQSGSDSFERVPLAPLSFEGDLVSFVTSERLAPIIGLPAETVAPYAANPLSVDAQTGSLDLFGADTAAPSVLVGTSYSANPNWSFLEALKLSLSQDIVNYAQEGRGPIAPMQDFLDKLDPANAPPVVIWEFPIRYLSDPSLKDTLNNSGDENA